MNKRIIALDAYAAAWERAFGVYPKEKDPQAYWALDRWEVEHLSGERLDSVPLRQVELGNGLKNHSRFSEATKI